MSKINQKPNWQSKNNNDHFVTPQDNTENILEDKLENNVEQPNNVLDMNLVIVSFQEKLAQLTTELVVKDATIRQLTNTINNMRGQK